MAELDLQRLRSQLWVQRRGLLIGATLFAVSVLLLLLVFLPLWNRNRVIQSDIGRERQSLEKIRQRAALLNEIKPEDQAKFNQVGLALPLGKQPLVVLQTLESIATESGVSLGKFDLSPGLISTQGAVAASRQSARSRETQAVKAETLTISVDMVGEFSEIQQALALIEQALPLMEVVEISLNPESRVAGFAAPTTNYVANLSIHSYYSQLDAKELARQTATSLTPAQLSTLEKILASQFRLSTTVDTTVPPSNFLNQDLFGLQSGSAVVPNPTPATAPTAQPTVQPTAIPEETPQAEVLL